VGLGLKAFEREGLAIIVHSLEDMSVFLPLEPSILPIEANRPVLAGHQHSEGFIGKQTAVDDVYTITKTLDLPLILVIM